MTLVLNKGQRSFILKSGSIDAGKVAKLEDSEAQKLAGMYPQEIEIIQPQPVQQKAPVAEIAEPEVKQEESKAAVAPLQKAKKGYKK